jgi:hypothetical protein
VERQWGLSAARAAEEAAEALSLSSPGYAKTIQLACENR